MPPLTDSEPATHRGGVLEAARADFREVLVDIGTPQAGITLDHVRAARSLHELWHLRAEIFSLVSCRHSQSEANRRLARIDSHFTGRSRRPGAATRRARAGSPSSLTPF